MGGSFRRKAAASAIRSGSGLRKAQRALPCTLNFPSGDRSRVNLNDAFFEAMGASTGSRDAYAESTISFKGSDYRVL
jgi:hypothetical protein